MSVGVIGLGYVGLPLAVAFAEAGEDVVAVDVDPRKIAAIRAGDSYVEDISSERLAAVLPKIHATSHYQPLARADAVLICVPTPLTANREPDLGALISSAHALGLVLQRGQLVVLESTTYPGTTRERLVPILEQESELRVGEEVNVAFSPERVDPGRTDYQLKNTPKVIGGVTPACGDRAAELYGRICDHIVRVSTPEAAEMTKLLENIFRSVNIALVNELAILSDRMGIDIWEVVDAAVDQALRLHALRAGAGDGRPLPARRSVLSDLARARVSHVDRVHRARRQDQPADALPLRRADRRRAQPARQTRQGLADRDPRRQLQGRRRRHPRIAGAADHRGARDPGRADPLPRPVRALAPRSRAAEHRRSRQATQDADAIVLVTAHPGIDHAALARDARLFVDLRGVTRGERTSNLIRL